MSSSEWAQAGLQAFDAVVRSTEGFRSSAGQRGMAEQVARTFSQAQLGKVDEEDGEPTRAIAVIQAGTGVGKSLAYCAPAIAIALARGTRVLISTATVALQEQLVNKDLPALAAQMEQPFKFVLAKGRGRYVCKLKLERLAGTGEAHGEDDDDLFPEEAASARPKRSHQETEARMQFYASMAQTLAQGAWDGDRDSLSHLTWIDGLSSRALRIGTLVEVTEVADIPRHASQLRQHLQDLARLVMDLYGEALKGQNSAWGPARMRVPRGVLPEALHEPLGQLAHHAAGFLECLRAISKALRAEMRDKPDESRRLSQLYAQIGTLAPRLEEVHATAQLLLQEAPEGEATGFVPNAKWFTLEMDGDFIVVKAHASPILPGSTLRNHLWSSVRGAVLTSATLTSCGQFDFFLRESGLHGDEAATTLEVPSPFNYAAQGTLIAAETHADPKNAVQFTAEMVDALLHDLARVEYGALVLFTSREQMRQAVDALATVMRPLVLVQNQMPRTQLLARHRERVAAGEPSIIFGMQSFGEGLDLPGPLCESVFITKLPFAPPDDPVGEARAEWLRAVGRDPFSELVVPATAIRLAQWAGRAIRTEEDQAHVYCYDKRLTRTSYGQRLLKGLPPFTLERRGARGQ